MVTMMRTDQVLVEQLQVHDRLLFGSGYRFATKRIEAMNIVHSTQMVQIVVYNSEIGELELLEFGREDELTIVSRNVPSY